MVPVRVCPGLASRWGSRMKFGSVNTDGGNGAMGIPEPCRAANGSYSPNCKALVILTIDEEIRYTAYADNSDLNYWDQVGDARLTVPFGRIARGTLITEETAKAHVGRLVEAGLPPVLTYGDDGEKLGLWPGTEALAGAGGWLDRFFSLLEEQGDALCTTTPQSVMARHVARGTAYLPTGSPDHTLDVYRPTDRTGPLPVVLYVHGGGWAVYRVDGGKAVLTPIEIGARNGLEVEVVEGLDAGTTVIAHPSDQVEDGRRVRPRRG